MSRGLLYLGVVCLVTVLFFVSIVLIQWAWAWVVPDIFIGLVNAGYLPTTLTFWQAFKLSVLLAVTVGASRI